MGDKKIDSESGLIISIVVILVAGLLGWAALMVGRRVEVLSKGPFIKTANDLTNQATGALEDRPAIYTGFIVPDSTHHYLVAPNVHKFGVVYYIYREYHRYENSDGDISWNLEKTEFRYLDFKISIGGFLFTPKFNRNGDNTFQSVYKESKDRRLYTEYLMAGELVTVLALKHGDVLSNLGGFYPYFLKDTEGDLKRRDIISIVLLSVFGLMILFLGIRGLISSITGD